MCRRSSFLFDFYYSLSNKLLGDLKQKHFPKQLTAAPNLQPVPATTFGVTTKIMAVGPHNTNTLYIMYQPKNAYRVGARWRRILLLFLSTSKVLIDKRPQKSSKRSLYISLKFSSVCVVRCRCRNFFQFFFILFFFNILKLAQMF